MNSYLVERYLPGMSEAELRRGLERAQTVCAELRSDGAEILYLGSILLPLEEACFCRFDADSEATIAEVNVRAELPCARITAGVTIDPELVAAAELCTPAAIPPGTQGHEPAVPPETAGPVG